MATITVNRPDRFPPGTSVGLYLAIQRHDGTPPTGSPIDTQTVQSDGTLTYAGLADGLSAFLYAVISGSARYLSVSTAPLVVSGGVGPQGPQGATGAQGPAGPAGPPGIGGGGWPVAGDAVVFVSATQGNDAYDGLSPGTAKKTIAAGLATVPTGGVVVVGAGAYTEANLTPAANNVRVVGVGVYSGNAGVRIQPPADDSTLVTTSSFDGSTWVNIQFRNHSRANWHGLFVHNDGSLYTKFINCKFMNNVANCPISAGVNGGTAISLTQGEGVTFENCEFNGIHLAMHIGREASLPFIVNCNSIGNFHELRIDNDAGQLYDDMTSYPWGFVTGSTAIMDASVGQLTALSTGAAQTVKVNDKKITFGSWLPGNQRQSLTVTVGAAGSFGPTLRSKVATVSLAGGTTQTPANGGTLQISSAAGLPVAGLIFGDNSDVMSYSGIVGNVLQNIQRNLFGTVNSGNLSNSKTMYVPTGDALFGRYNATAQALEVGTIVAGVQTVLASAPLALTPGSVRYLDFEAEDDTLTLKAFTADPYNLSDPFWLAGTPVATVTTTLAGTDKTNFGVGVVGAPGHVANFGDTAWRADDARIHVYGGLPGGGTTVTRWKATNKIVQKRRDGVTLTSSVAPVHRSEYDVWTMPGGVAGTGSAVYKTVDMSEGFGQSYVFWGDCNSTFENCVNGAMTTFAGDHNTIDEYKNVDASVPQATVVTGNRNEFKNLKTDGFTDLGRGNLFSRPDWKGTGFPEMELPDTVLMNATSDAYARQRGVAQAPRRVGAYYGNAFAGAATEDTIAPAYNAAVGNGYMSAIYTGGVCSWDQLVFEVTVAGGATSKVQVSIYALDEFTLLPQTIVVSGGGATQPLLLDAGFIDVSTVGEKVVPVSLRTAPLWIAVNVNRRSGGGVDPVLRAQRASKTSPAPWGYDSPLDSKPGIFMRGNFVDGGAPSLLAFNASPPTATVSQGYITGFTDLGPIVRLRRSA